MPVFVKHGIHNVRCEWCISNLPVVPKAQVCVEVLFETVVEIVEHCFKERNAEWVVRCI